VIRRKISEERSWHYTKDEFPKMQNIYEMLLKHLRFHMISCNGIVERKRCLISLGFTLQLALILSSL
jgi:hypothetical protein